MKTVYVIYLINKEEGDCEDLHVFADYREAKWYVMHHEGEYRIWERPIEEKDEHFYN